MATKNLLVIVDKRSVDIFQENVSKLSGVNVIAEYVSEPEKIEQQAVSADIVLLLSWKPVKQTLKRILEVNPNIEWVHTWWAGVDSLIYPELKKLPLILTNGRGQFAEALAEFAVAACLYFAKDFPRLLNNKKAVRWEQFQCEMLSGKTLGIFGYGEIGKSTAKKLKALGMRVRAVKRRVAADFHDANLERIMGPRGLLDLCRQSDYLVSSAPLTAETRGVLNASIFSEMKPEAVFINVGRGPVVNEADLVKALSSGTIKAAALDVFEREPLDPASPLWAMDNVLISPHCADQCCGWLTRSIDFYVENLSRFLGAKTLKNIVNLDLGY